MLTLTYNLKCGFKEAYVVLKNQEYEISHVIDVINYMPEELAEEVIHEPMTEEAFYEEYHNDIDALLDLLESTGLAAMWYECTILDVAHTYFENILKEEKVAPGIWEPSRIKLKYTKE